MSVVEVLKTDDGVHLFTLGDSPTIQEKEALGVPLASNKAYATLGVYPRDVRAFRTGEFREPKAGEWYLSGAEPQAWRAPNDLSTKYRICRLARIRTITRVAIVKALEHL